MAIKTQKEQCQSRRVKDERYGFKAEHGEKSARVTALTNVTYITQVPGLE